MSQTQFRKSFEVSHGLHMIFAFVSKRKWSVLLWRLRETKVGGRRRGSIYKDCRHGQLLRYLAAEMSPTINSYVVLLLTQNNPDKWNAISTFGRPSSVPHLIIIHLLTIYQKLLGCRKLPRSKSFQLQVFCNMVIKGFK